MHEEIPLLWQCHCRTVEPLPNPEIDVCVIS